MTRISFSGGRFVCRCTFDTRAIPRGAGFLWDASARQWYTLKHSTAARLREYFDESARSEYERHFIQVTPWPGRVEVPPGQNLYPYQIESAHFLLSRNRAYLGADPGLGKTPVAARVAAHIENALVVYTCPPFLTRNTEAEFNTWAPDHLVHRWTSRGKNPIAQVTVVADTLLTNPALHAWVRELKAYAAKALRPLVLFVDEAHRFKNGDSQRTRGLLGGVSRKRGRPVRRTAGLYPLFDRVFFMSGTPMPNRPMELFPILSRAATGEIDFMNRFEFGRRYCAGFQTDFGWDFTGASRLSELRERVVAPTGKFMLRIRKDVLDLPPKTEEMVVLADDYPAKLARMDARILAELSPEDLMRAPMAALVGKSNHAHAPDPLHLMEYRRLLGEAKVGASLDFIRSVLEVAGEKDGVLIFAIHKSVIASLQTELADFRPVVITGETPMAERHERVRLFQSGASSVFIGNIQAAGVGITLTRASRVIFVEFAWTPGDNDQAADRAHRIGQRKNVHVQYLVYKDSVDRKVIETILRKRQTIKYV